MAKKKKTVSPTDILANEVEAATEDMSYVDESSDHMVDDSVVEERNFDIPEDTTNATSEKASEPVEEKNTKVVSKSLKVSNVERMTAFLDEYDKIANRQPIITRPIQKQLVAKFQNIMQFSLRVKEKAVFEVLYNFFMQKDKTLMAPEVALQGIHTLPPNASMRLECFYTVFNEMVIFKKTKPYPGQKKKFPLDLAGVREAVGCEEFVNFVSSKIS